MNTNHLTKYFDVILKPVVTEKSTRGRENGCITFFVSKKADKKLIKKTVETIFATEVARVNTINVRGERKFVRGKKSYISGYKKAIVKLAKPEAVEKIMGS